MIDAGLDVACFPVADVAGPETTAAIGDRAFGDDPELVARLARIAARTLDAFGVGAVAKHAPGHGRAREDSHALLPRVDAPRAELEARDFVPFRALADVPFVMTAHVLCEALDPERPASLSPAVHRLLRGELGLRGIVISDDLAMGALEGPPGRRAAAARAAGADLALYCPGDVEGSEAVLEAAGELAPQVEARLAGLLAGWTARRRPLPAERIASELERRLSA
ncbi:Beta-hexosaminidase [bacterium HR39]|nr:Beta-hexosaminidase [bacterium HR39]